MTEITINEASKAEPFKGFKSLVRDKRTWAFVAALATAAGFSLSPDVASALGVLLEVLQAPAN